MKFPPDCLKKPVMLFLKNGQTFSMFDGKTNRETIFFCISSISKQSITFMKLLPCYVCHTDFCLQPTYQYVSIDSEMFCGYHIIENACIRKCKRPSVCFTDSFCEPFTILPGYDEAILWKSNINEKQFGTLQLCLEEEPDSFAEIVIHHPTGYKRYRLCSNTYFLDQCKQITIKSNGTDQVKGVFKIEMDSVIEYE